VASIWLETVDVTSTVLPQFFAFAKVSKNEVYQMGQASFLLTSIELSACEVAS